MSEPPQILPPGLFFFFVQSPAVGGLGGIKFVGGVIAQEIFWEFGAGSKKSGNFSSGNELQKVHKKCLFPFSTFKHIAQFDDVWMFST